MDSEDIFSVAINLTIVGVVTVFFVQLLIAGALVVIGRIEASATKKELPKEEPAHALARTPSVDEFTVLLISAAVATYLTGRYRIRAIRRVGPADRSGMWSSHGRMVLMGSHAVSRGGRGPVKEVGRPQ